MKIEKYNQIIFTEDTEELKAKIKDTAKGAVVVYIGWGSSADPYSKNKYTVISESMHNIYLGMGIDVSGYFGYFNLIDVLRHNGFFIGYKYTYFLDLIDIINSSQDCGFECMYIHIKNIDNIINSNSSYCYRLNFFNLLNSITNKQIYFIIDIKYKDYVFNQIEEYNKHINRLRSFGEIHNQVIFVDDIEKVKQNINTETEMFNELDGNKCRDIRSFYRELIDGWKFPNNLVKKLETIDDWLNDYLSLLWNKDSNCSVIFKYISNIKKILPNNRKEMARICDILYSIYNEKVFILIDKKDKDYFLEQVEIGKKY